MDTSPFLVHGVRELAVPADSYWEGSTIVCAGSHNQGEFDEMILLSYNLFNQTKSMEVYILPRKIFKLTNGSKF